MKHLTQDPAWQSQLSEPCPQEKVPWHKRFSCWCPFCPGKCFESSETSAGQESRFLLKPTYQWQGEKKCYLFISSICQVLWQNRSSSYPNKKGCSAYWLHFQEAQCHSNRAACRHCSAQQGKKSWTGTDLLCLPPQPLTPAAPTARNCHPIRERRCW